MSILFVLLMFLLIISVRYFIEPKNEPVTEMEILAKAKAPLVKREFGFEIPQNYCFHLGHMWMSKESSDDARVGVDKFTTNLLGKVEHIAVRGADRWVRQGQKLVTIRGNGASIDLVSPVEGVVTAINEDALRDPSLLTKDPYEQGWIAIVKSPDLKINQRNLIQGAMVAPWMQNNVTRLNGMLAGPAPALMQDGGDPIPGLLAQLDGELKQSVMKEFFLS